MTGKTVLGSSTVKITFNHSLELATMVGYGTLSIKTAYEFHFCAICSKNGIPLSLLHIIDKVLVFLLCFFQ